MNRTCEGIFEIQIDNAIEILRNIIKKAECLEFYFPLFNYPIHNGGADYTALLTTRANGYSLEKGGHGIGTNTGDLKDLNLVIDALLKFNAHYNDERNFHYSFK